MKKVLVNFASPQSMYTRAQARACAAARALNLFDLILPYQAADLGKDFHKKHHDIFRYKRGYGFWLWKPYLLLKALQREDLKAGDLVFYSDTDHLWKPTLREIMDLFIETKSPMLAFTGYDIKDHRPHYGLLDTFVKQDVLLLTQKELEIHAAQIYATYIFFRKGPEAMAFCQAWYEHMQHEHMASETPSYLREDPDTFMWHLHDQAVFSALYRAHRHRYCALCEEDVVPDRVQDPLFLTSVSPVGYYAHAKTPEFSLPLFQRKAISLKNYIKRSVYQNWVKRWTGSSK